MSNLEQTLRLLEEDRDRWLDEARASFWKDGRIPYIPKWLKIVLMTNFQLEGIIHGEIIPTNIPKGTKIYDVRMWKRDEVGDTLAIWMVHPEFPEYHQGDHVYTEHLQFMETGNE